MKLSILLSLLCFGLGIESSYASSGPPESFFREPSYIDTDYNQSKKIHLLVEAYQNTNPPVEKPSDSNARIISAEQEPGNYSEYLKGAEKFNAQEYEDALKIFSELKINQMLFRKKYSWTVEAATYMIARCQLIIAQKKWDGYSNPVKTVDQNMLKAADASYQIYLKEYPHGLYVDSARHIYRSIFYLSGNQAALDKELKHAMLEAFPIAPTSKINSNLDILDEIENHFHGEIDIAYDSPILVAYVWLNDAKNTSQDVVLLEARKKDFSNYPGLFRYLYALGLYRLGQYQKLLDKTPEEPLVKNTIVLSTQLLRARALSRLDKSNEALVALEKMHTISPEDAVELQIAYIKLNSGDGLWLFGEQSLISTEKNLRSFAQFGLTDGELEKGIGLTEITNEKHKFLVDELARRYLLSKRFDKLTLLLAKESGTGIFTPVKSASAVLVKNADNAQALADIGEFIYQHYITPDSTFENYAQKWEHSDPSIELLANCKSCLDFQVRSKDYVPPITFFRAAVALVQHSGRKNEAEAKALHYITRCNRGMEFKDRCTWGKEEIADGSSQDAFNLLHKRYKNSPWAVKTPYYYEPYS